MKKLIRWIPVCASLVLSMGLWGARGAQAAPTQTEQAKGTPAGAKSSKPKKYMGGAKSHSADKKPAVSATTTSTTTTGSAPAGTTTQK